MRLILHAGTHKTGTTSIQKALYEHRDYLREHGLYSPFAETFTTPKKSKKDYRLTRALLKYAGSFGLKGLLNATLDPFIGSRAHLNLSHLIADNTTQSTRSVERFFDEVRRNMRDGETIILSSEAIYRHVLGTRVLSAMLAPDYFQNRQRYLEALREFLVGFDTEVVLYVRDYGYFLSWLRRALEREGAWSGSGKEFKVQYSEHFAYEKQIALFQEFFPKVIVHSYEEAKAESLIAHFFRSIGFPVPPGAETIWERPTKRPIKPL
jgi:hypothetical protein